LPPEERRDVGIFWGRYDPAEVIDRFERLEARGCYLEGIRDGDRTLTLRAKFMLALIVNFEAHFEEELAEADRFIEAMNTKKVVAALDDEEEYAPPEQKQSAGVIAQGARVQ
jgi:hypothetical protein